MTYSAISPIGADLSNNVDSEKKFTLGTRVVGQDPTLGQGEFIYLLGVASVVAGDVVVYNEAFATTRAVAASRGPLAVALGATVAAKYGWFQIKGTAIVSVLAADAADVAQYLTATDGNLDDAVVAANAITGAVSMSAIDTPSTGKAYVALAYPFASGDLDA
jgi:hypothetical protein